MLNIRRIALCLLPWFAFLAAPAAHAQWAVIDVNAIVQLTQQVSVLRQQLTTAENELTQAQSTFTAMTGSRGMQNLLNGTVRKLPAHQSWRSAVRVAGNLRHIRRAVGLIDRFGASQCRLECAASFPALACAAGAAIGGTQRQCTATGHCGERTVNSQ